ncbi:MAG: hypothetical protein ACI9DK_002924 [Vicingaceae bacterium]|jgi:hypothetical protein
MKTLYRVVFKIVNVLFPRIYEKDLTHLSKILKGVVALKYWLTIKLLN